jgi:hypothetical protein
MEYRILSWISEDLNNKQFIIQLITFLILKIMDQMVDEISQK